MLLFLPVILLSLFYICLLVSNYPTYFSSLLSKLIQTLLFPPFLVIRCLYSGNQCILLCQSLLGIEVPRTENNSLSVASIQKEEQGLVLHNVYSASVHRQGCFIALPKSYAICPLL